MFIEIKKLFIYTALIGGLILGIGINATASVQDEIVERNRQIEELQRQIDEYEAQADKARYKSKTLENEIARLNAEIGQVQLEIRSLNLSISKTTDEIKETEGQISVTEDQMTKHRNALAQYIKLAYENDQRSLTEILLRNDSISDFFNELNNISATQDNLQLTIKGMKELKIQLESHQNQLEEQQTDLERSKRLQEIEKRTLDSTKTEQNKLLKDTKGQESKFQELVKKSQKDIEALRAQVRYLEQNGVTAEDAVKFGQLAALRTGIRPEYLIAVLEQESGIGANVGKCNRAGDPPEKSYKSIMKPTRDIQPFLQITSELGMDPEVTAVSCPQYVRGKQYGWGGAMGPAQFIPSTWMGYREEVSRLTGHNPANPWIIEDAFVAAAAKLAKAGATAKTRASEISASKAYYSGNSRCSTAPCNSYANSIQRLAAEIAKNI